MNLDELRAIKKRANAATPGPWYVRFTDDDMSANMVAVTRDPAPNRHDHGYFDYLDPERVIAITAHQNHYPAVHGDLDEEEWGVNARFIAAAREDMPRVVDYCITLKGANDLLQDQIGFAGDVIQRLMKRNDDLTRALDKAVGGVLAHAVEDVDALMRWLNSEEETPDDVWYCRECGANPAISEAHPEWCWVKTALRVMGKLGTIAPEK